MARLLRRALGGDGSGNHLEGAQMMFALVAAAASATVWGYATRLPFVALVTLLTQVFFAWLTPAAAERPGARLSAAFLAGGMWAAIGMLVAGR